MHRRLQGALVILVCVLSAGAGCAGPGTPMNASPSASPSIPPPHPPMPLYVFSLSDMQKNLASGVTLSLPTSLPDGFFFTNGMVGRTSWDDPADTGTFWFTYTRGQDDTVTLTEQSRNSTACADGPEYRPMEIGKTRTQKPGSSELTWARSGWCFTLSSTLSRKEMEAIAASVQPVPYREGVIPPFEYQPPAHPLTGNFTVNRSAADQGITITIETLRCVPEGCTAEVRLGISSPPAFSAPPEITVAPEPPEPHAEWRVDGGRPLLMMSGSGGYRPEGATTLTFWNIEPLPAGSRELTVRFSQVRGISGQWLIPVPLNQSPADERMPADRTVGSP